MILSEAERDALLRAIETVIEVQARPHFQAWVRGPFRRLLPHAGLVGVELDGAGEILHCECLHHGFDAAAAAAGDDEDLHSRRGDLACRIARAFHGRPELPPTIRGDLLDGVGDHPDGADALIHRTQFLSGAACYFVLFDVPPEAGPSGRHHLRLLSGHLKTAWSRVNAMPLPAPTITEREREILGWMEQGKSNQEISAILGISPLTLKAHVRKIYRKLDVDSREAALSRVRASRRRG